MTLLNRHNPSVDPRVKTESLVERVVQFGEGNFLRGFADWIIHRANASGHYDGSVVVAQPIARGLVPLLNAQDGLFTVILRGRQHGERVFSEEVVSSVSRGVQCDSEWSTVLECAADPNIEVVISNTTEAGISYAADDALDLSPPSSFPGKLCAYLYRRFEVFNGADERGMLIIPCELIDRNGDTLRAIVLRHADEWGLGDDFAAWVRLSCTFVNTLVDRIVTGFPDREEVAAFHEKWGYEDRLIVTAEPFHLWVIEGPKEAAERFPVHRAGLDVLWVDDMTPYRTRKVRILNGTHTATVAVAYLAGIDYVREAVEDDVIGSYMRSVVFDEILPTLDMDRDELELFAEQVLERFQNPFIKHRWLDISLNTIPKYRTRVLPTLLTHLTSGRMPPLLTFSMAATLAFYRGELNVDGALVGRRNSADYAVRDDADVLTYFAALWRKHASDPSGAARAALSNEAFWGLDLSRYREFTDQVAAHLTMILEGDCRNLVAELQQMSPTPDAQTMDG